MQTLSQDHHGRDPYRVALRNNNAAVAELLESHMKRLSDYRGDHVTRLREADQGDTGDSPLYASPTAYGYSKIGEHRPAGAGARAQARQTAETQILAGEWHQGQGILTPSSRDWNHCKLDCKLASMFVPMSR